MTTLAERLIDATKDLPRGWQADLARHCKVRPSSVTDWLTGKSKSITSASLIDAAEYLKVSPKWLATGEGNKDTSSTPPQPIITKDPILDDLAALLPEDAEVWRAQIRAAAIKARRAKEEKRERQEQGVADPPLISRRASSM